MEETDEIKISLDGNYCVTRDGDTARKLKKMLDLKYNVGAVVDGEIKSSSLTIQIKSENEYVVKPKDSSKMDLRLQLPNSFSQLKNYLEELLPESESPSGNYFGGSLPLNDDKLTAFDGEITNISNRKELFELFDEYQINKDKEICLSNDKTVLAASIHRWISQLSSEFLFDDLELFYNTYRLYLNQMELAEILFKRFEWTLEDSDKFDESQLELVRVRTFVMIRGWLSNYFGYDFVPNLELRLRLSEWINHQREQNNEKSRKMIEKMINVARERQNVYENYKKYSLDESISSFDSNLSQTDGKLSLDFDPGPPTTLPSSNSSKFTMNTNPTSTANVGQNDSITGTFFKTFNKFGKFGKRIISNRPQKTIDEDDTMKNEYTISLTFEEFCQLQEIPIENNNDNSSNEIKNKENDSIMTKIMQLDDLDYSDDSSSSDTDEEESFAKAKKLPHVRQDRDSGKSSRSTVKSMNSTESQIEANWQNNFTIEGLESDEEEDGDVDAALRALEGQIDKVKQEEKLRKVETMMERSKKKRLSQSGNSNTSSPAGSPLIRTKSVFQSSTNGVGNGNSNVHTIKEVITHKPRSHSVAITTPSRATQHTNRKRGLSQGSSVIIDKAKKNGIRSWILQYRTEIIAKQFTLIERDLFNEIKFEHIENLNNWKEDYYKFDTIISWISFMKEHARKKVIGDANGCSVRVIIARFNMTVRWVASEILITASTEDRTSVIGKFIRLAFKCQQQNNFMTLMAILRGLEHPLVKRMADAWPHVSKQSMRMLTTLKKFCSNADNFSMLRHTSLNQLNKNLSETTSERRMTRDRSSSSVTGSGVGDINGCIPFIGIFLNDLLQANNSPNYLERDSNEVMVNIQKLRLIHSTRKTIELFQTYSTNQFDHRSYLDGDLYRKCLKLRLDCRVIE
ncbi:ras GEF [Wallemia mellicola]|uniref:Ras GEF n=1 Tax=Wallemia mellicola TaxID=1708541 RepID=A0A4T0NUV9_9BASI|nr:ras GEF [Wallemia mellicola]TIC01236.1 ras GEF [Wallemia mellicola]TIC32787.1 ras GEF [Wallemia mellicola]TIC75513.1 ras GEF [Wallemia mellicola]